jgi:hypothetical protein
VTIFAICRISPRTPSRKIAKTLARSMLTRRFMEKLLMWIGLAALVGSAGCSDLSRAVHHDNIAAHERRSADWHAHRALVHEQKARDLRARALGTAVVPTPM